MAGVAANRLIGVIRGKDKVNRPRKPKEQGNKPRGPTW